MRNLFLIEGFKVNYSIFGGSFLGKSIKAIGHISSYNLEKLSNQNAQKSAISVENLVDLETKEIKVGVNMLFITNYRTANKMEEKLYDKILREKNIVFEERCLEDHWVGGVRHKNVLCAYYISKDDFVIRLGDKAVTYKELKELGFEDDDKIVLSGDNGYSHVWESTIKATDIFKFIDGLFGIANRFMCVNQGRAHRGEYFGWHFNDYGELVIRVTKVERNFSQVSFS